MTMIPKHQNASVTIDHSMGAYALFAWLRAFLKGLPNRLPDPDEGGAQYTHRIVLTMIPVHENAPDGTEPEPSEIDIDDLAEVPRARVKGLLDEMPNTKIPNNTSERALMRFMRKQGWTCSKKGWPDFFCVHTKNSHQIALVEVKPHRGRRLRTHQKAVMLALAAFGVPCYRWSPESGFEQIGIAAEHLEDNIRHGSFNPFLPRPPDADLDKLKEDTPQ